MSKPFWLLGTALAVFTAPAFAQDAAAPASPAEPAAVAAEPGEIVVTATRRSQILTDVPIAISAVSAQSLQNSGATDIRGLNQLSPSLLVSSTSSEAVGGGARIRGIGTVGDNPGLESSVATFIDGVYRSRAGVALTELGAIERIEVLRGPQGTLFGRNASSGLINVITQAPSFDEGGTAEVSYGNYDYWRALVGLTGPIGEKVAYRIDGVYTKRDGFLKESGGYAGAGNRDFNNRDRWLVRGQLKLEPSDVLSVRLIADYAKRNEECCAATYLQSRDVVRNTDGSLSFPANSFKALENRLGGVVNDDTYARRVSVTPGRDYRSDVRDWGLSGEVNWELGGVKLTSITAYRDWKVKRGQDADFSNLDILYRDNWNQQFKTFTQEFRVNGKAFEDKLDWLVGGYYGNETLTLTDNLRYGRDYGRVEGCRVAAGATGALTAAQITNSGLIQPGAAGCLNPLARPTIQAQLGPFGPGLLSMLDRLTAISDIGSTTDRYRQKDETWALFTHNVFNITDQLSLTLGARYTHDKKKLTTTIASDNNVCAQQAAVFGPLRTSIQNAAAGGLISSAQAAQLIGLGTSIFGLSCANNSTGGVDGTYRDARTDSEWTGTGVLSFKPTDRLLTYASFSRGFKAGGFNLDRAGLSNPFTSGGVLPNATQLRFAPEKVDAFEVGAKYRGRGFRLGASAFYQMFKNFQLNTFNGTSFIVESIQGCSTLNGGDGSDSDLVTTNGQCTGKSKAGVIAKGVEVEASFYPVRDFSVDLGYTLADTKYRSNLAGAGRALTTALFQLPGRRLSNAPLHTITGGATWTPELTSGGIGALFHADFRYQSAINTGSDLLPEKIQQGVIIVNGRIGLTGPQSRWGIELWGQNLFNTDYAQTIAGAPVQGSGSIANIQAGAASPANGLYIVFPSEPRTYGLTVRTKF